MDDFIEGCWLFLSRFKWQSAEGTGSCLFMSEATRIAFTVATYSIDSLIDSSGVIKTLVLQISGGC